MIRARVTSSWNPNAEQQILDQAMTNLLQRARRAVPTVTCPAHHSTHHVNWARTSDGLTAAVDEPCCHAIQGELDTAVKRAKR